jgi:hypothetical protein
VGTIRIATNVHTARQNSGAPKLSASLMDHGKVFNSDAKFTILVVPWFVGHDHIHQQRLLDDPERNALQSSDEDDS